MKRQTNMTVAWYVIAVFVASVPFWLVGTISDWELMPGVPFAAAMAVAPGLVAFVFAAQALGIAGALRWLSSAIQFDASSGRVWIPVSILVLPAIMFVTYVIMLFAGRNMPEPEINAGQLLTLLLIFFAPGLLEEVGWSGYAVGSLQQRMSALAASLIIGVVWSAWHFVPLLQVGRTVSWIAWWSIGTIAIRILITWIYNGSGHSCLAAALAHASENVSWQAFPNNGSHYDPEVHGIVLVVASGLIVVLFGGSTLARKKTAPTPGTAERAESGQSGDAR